LNFPEGNGALLLLIGVCVEPRCFCHRGEIAIIVSVFRGDFFVW